MRVMVFMDVGVVVKIGFKVDAFFSVVFLWDSVYFIYFSGDFCMVYWVRGFELMSVAIGFFFWFGMGEKKIDEKKMVELLFFGVQIGFD